MSRDVTEFSGAFTYTALPAGHELFVVGINAPDQSAWPRAVRSEMRFSERQRALINRSLSYKCVGVAPCTKHACEMSMRNERAKNISDGFVWINRDASRCDSNVMKTRSRLQFKNYDNNSA